MMLPGRIIEAGVSLKTAGRILIMLHGRGALAENILSLSEGLPLNDYFIAAPQAQQRSWYPNSFLAPVETNEPWLSHAINLLLNMTESYKQAGFSPSQIFFLGFSQGACLALEFAARHAQPWGGIIAFSGGLIGEVPDKSNYQGNFMNSKVFIGNGDDDPHIPLSRCEETASILKALGADVKLAIYPEMGHYVNDQELEEASQILLGS